MTDTQAIEKHTNGEHAEVAVASGVPFEQDTIRLAKAMAQSGFFKDAGGVAQAVVKILAGRELGFAPVASMTGVYIVDGKVTISANLMAAAIKRSGRYNYRVRELTNEACRIEFFEGKESIGVSEFTIEDADRAGLAGKPTWMKFTRNLLFARAMSNGARFHCADVFGGPTYTPEELGAIVGEDGTPLGAESSQNAPAAPQTPASRPAAPQPTQEPHVDAESRELPDEEGLGPVKSDPGSVLDSFGGDPNYTPDASAEEVAALFDAQGPKTITEAIGLTRNESELRQEVRALHAKVINTFEFRNTKLPAEDAPDTKWSEFLDYWPGQLEQAKRAAERRGQAAARPGR